MDKTPKFEVKDETGAPFNMALATLYKIHGILKDIFYSSTMHDHDMTEGEAQHLKYRCIRQLYVQSIPLIDQGRHADWLDEVYHRIKDLKARLVFKEMYKGRTLVGKQAIYDDNLENDLDVVTIMIQQKLQEEKYFMPPKDDLRYSWKEV